MGGTSRVTISAASLNYFWVAQTKKKKNKKMKAVVLVFVIVVRIKVIKKGINTNKYIVLW
jgi:hypothetical protein